MNLQITGKDINNIGYKVFDNEGYLTIVTGGSCYGLEDIFLRNILRCFGEQYEVTNSYDFERPYEPKDSDKMDVAWDTNLPWDVYMNDSKLNDGIRKVEVEESDKERIGCQSYGDWVLCYAKTAAIEMIFLSSILKCWGEEQYIEEIKTCTAEESPNGKACVKFFTSLPF